MERQLCLEKGFRLAANELESWRLFLMNWDDWFSLLVQMHVFFTVREEVLGVFHEFGGSIDYSVSFTHV